MAFLASLLWIFDQFGSKLNGIFPNMPESPKHNILGPVTDIHSVALLSGIL